MAQPIYVGNNPVPSLEGHRVMQGGWAFGLAELIAGAAVVRLTTRGYLRWDENPDTINQKEIEQSDEPITTKWIPLAAGLFLMFGGASVLAKRVAYILPNGASGASETGACSSCSSNYPRY